jgi:hypothetical protein
MHIVVGAEKTSATLPRIIAIRHANRPITVIENAGLSNLEGTDAKTLAPNEPRFLFPFFLHLR